MTGEGAGNGGGSVEAAGGGKDGGGSGGQPSGGVPGTEGAEVWTVVGMQGKRARYSRWKLVEG